MDERSRYWDAKVMCYGRKRMAVRIPVRIVRGLGISPGAPVRVRFECVVRDDWEGSFSKRSLSNLRFERYSPFYPMLDRDGLTWGARTLCLGDGGRITGVRIPSELAAKNNLAVGLVARFYLVDVLDPEEFTVPAPLKGTDYWD